MKKRIFAMLVFVLLFIMVNLNFAYAAIQGEGTKTSPYIISTVEDMDDISDKTGYFKLGNDIDFKNVERIPLSLSSGSNFDGDGHVIKNLKISSSVDSGLFGKVTNVTIKNLIIENADVSTVSTSSTIGVLAGQASGSTIENIKLRGTIKVTSNTSQAGGLIGYALSTSTIKDVVITGSVDVSGSSYVGGVVGYLVSSTIENSKLLASLKIEGTNYVGGLLGCASTSQVLQCQVNSNIIVNKGSYIGVMAGSVDNSNSNVTLSQVNGTLDTETITSTNIGGFIGYMSAGKVTKSISNMTIIPNNAVAQIGSFIGNMSGGSVSNSYSLGDVNTTKAVGFIGQLYSAAPRIAQCYSATEVTSATKVDMVGLYSSSSDSYISSSYFDRSLTPVTTTNTFSRTTLEMKSKANYSGWDFTSIWKFETGKYPTLLEMPPIATADEENDNNNNSGENSFAKLSLLLEKEETVQLIMTAKISDNSKYDWVSNNTQVVTVDSNGKVTAVNDGITSIIVTNKTTNKSESISINVSGVSVNSEERLSVYMLVDSKIKLTVSDPDKQVTYTSMDPTVATISDDGVVTAVGNGMAIIKAEYDGKTELIYVTVTNDSGLN